MTLLLALAAQTTTTEVRRVVGDPLPVWVTVVAGLGCLALIVVLGWWFGVRRRG